MTARENISIVSIIPYRILPARLGGEKGIALFNEYLGQLHPLTGVSTKSNDTSEAVHYRMMNILSNGRLRYLNVFLYFTIRKIVVDQKATHLITEHPYYGWLAWLLRKSLPVTWIVHSHNIEYMRSQSIGRWWYPLLKKYESWVYRKADRNFFISADDLEHAVEYLGAERNRSRVVTYGIEQKSLPDDLKQAAAAIRARHAIAPEEKILLFNGALYHATNYEALDIILQKINPLLQQHSFRYKILVCGKGLPEKFNELKDYRGNNIIYAGFVDNIDDYFKAADLFLNPILTGGGVKTKAIEALAMNCTVISSELGAMGINRKVCGKKLYTVEKGDWEKFSELIITAAAQNDQTPDDFFDYYYWGNIVKDLF